MTREHKKQIWLRPDQVDLVADCLQFSISRFDEREAVVGAVDRHAITIARKRVQEIMPLFRPRPSPPLSAEER